MTVGSDLKADNAAQLVKLTASDVLGINDNSTIYISGDANDKVDLGGGLTEREVWVHLRQRQQLLKQLR